MGSDLLVNPSDKVPTGNITNKQKQTVAGLIQPAISQIVPGQGARFKMIWLGTRLRALLIPTMGKRPIPMQLSAVAIGTQSALNLRPGNVSVAGHEPVGDRVRDSLITKNAHQPVKDDRSIAVFNGSDEASI